jgi:hypothetical protein
MALYLDRVHSPYQRTSDGKGKENQILRPMPSYTPADSIQGSNNLGRPQEEAPDFMPPSTTFNWENPQTPTVLMEWVLTQLPLTQVGLLFC